MKIKCIHESWTKVLQKISDYRHDQNNITDDRAMFIAVSSIWQGAPQNLSRVETAARYLKTEVCASAFRRKHDISVLGIC